MTCAGFRRDCHHERAVRNVCVHLASYAPDAAAAIVSPLRPMYPGPTSMLLCQFLNLFRSVQICGSLFPPSLSDHVRAM